MYTSRIDILLGKKYSYLVKTFLSRVMPCFIPEFFHYSLAIDQYLWRSLVGCSPWDREESDKTERLHFHFSLSCIGEGNGNPFHCSCLENPRDSGACWAAIYGVAHSGTLLKRLSSSSSSKALISGRVF